MTMRALLLVGFLSHASAEQFTLGAGIKTISDQLSAVQLSGSGYQTGQASGRRMGVEALLKSVEHAQVLNDTAKEILQDAQALLQGILDDLITAKDAEQPSLDAVIDNVATCENTTSIGIEATKLQTSDTANATHRTCRAAQASAYDDMYDSCENVRDALAAYQTLDCTVTIDALRTNGQKWIDRFGELKDFFDRVQTSLSESKTEECVQDAEAHENKTDECDQAQQAYEEARCSYTNHLSLRCTQQQSCHNGFIAVHDSEVTRVFADANLRVEDAKMITYIMCLIDYLIVEANPVFETMISGCEGKKTDDYSAYNNTLPVIPDPHACVVNDWNPDNADWDGDEYFSGLSTVKAVISPLSITCGN